MRVSAPWLLSATSAVASTMGYRILAALGLSVRGGRGWVWSRHRQQVLLRREIRAQDVMFRTSVAVLLKQPYGWPQWLQA